MRNYFHGAGILHPMNEPFTTARVKVILSASSSSKSWMPVQGAVITPSLAISLGALVWKEYLLSEREEVRTNAVELLSSRLAQWLHVLLQVCCGALL